MTERFKDLKSRAGEKLSLVLRVSMGIPLDFEEVVANFQHKPSCSSISPLRIIEEKGEVYVPKIGAWDFGYHTTVVKKFAQCDECLTREQFLE